MTQTQQTQTQNKDEPALLSPVEGYFREALRQALRAETQAVSSSRSCAFRLVQVTGEARQVSESETAKAETEAQTASEDQAETASTATTRLLFLFQIHVEENRVVPVCALQSAEFHFPDGAHPQLLYIAKLDTCGLAEPRWIQRFAVRAMLSAHIQDRLSDSRSASSGSLRVHVLSSANPEYLFPESQKLLTKHALDGRSLIYWWKEVLAEVMRTAGGFGSRGWWTIPGLEYALVPRQHRIEKDTNTGWTWGYPYDPQANARSVVTSMFPDDAMCACLQRAVGGNDTVSVRAFFDGILERAPEFRKSDLGIFVVDLMRRSDSHREETFRTCTNHPQDSLLRELELRLNLRDGSNAEHRPIWTFATRQEAETSAKELLALIQRDSSLQISDISVAIPAEKPYAQLPSTSSNSIEPSKPAVVHVLSVKRKRK